MFRGELGQPYGGFPKDLQKKVLNGTAPLADRPGALLAPVDLVAARGEAEQKAGRKVTDQQFASYLMYPKVFLDWNAHWGKYGDVSVLPTSVFFYGMSPGEEVTIEGDPGKTLILRYLAVSEPHADGTRTAFFELNGAPRSVSIADRALKPDRTPAVRADAGNPDHVGAPMPGMIATVAVKPGDEVERGDMLLSIEAMKMEAGVRAERDGRIAEVLVQPGQQIDAKDLLIVFKAK
jgi:pyruvate carboxylase